MHLCQLHLWIGDDTGFLLQETAGDKIMKQQQQQKTRTSQGWKHKMLGLNIFQHFTFDQACESIKKGSWMPALSFWLPTYPNVCENDPAPDSTADIRRTTPLLGSGEPTASEAADPFFGGERKIAPFAWVWGGCLQQPHRSTCKVSSRCIPWFFPPSTVDKFGVLWHYGKLTLA